MGFILRKTNESIFAIFKFLLSTEIKLVGLPQGTIKNWKFKLLIWFLKIMSNLLQLKPTLLVSKNSSLSTVLPLQKGIKIENNYHFQMQHVGILHGYICYFFILIIFEREK